MPIGNKFFWVFVHFHSDLKYGVQPGCLTMHPKSIALTKPPHALLLCSVHSTVFCCSLQLRLCICVWLAKVRSAAILDYFKYSVNDVLASLLSLIPSAEAPANHLPLSNPSDVHSCCVFHHYIHKSPHFFSVSTSASVYSYSLSLHWVSPNHLFLKKI